MATTWSSYPISNEILTRQNTCDLMPTTLILYFMCCDIGQIDRLFIIELIPFIVLSSDNTNCKNDIQLFRQLFDELSVYRDYH